MHLPPLEQQLLVLIQGIALIALCIRFWRAGLHRVYIYFFSYLVMALVQTCVPAFVSFESPVYRDVYLVTESLVVCLYVLVVLELYSIIFQDLAGIATLLRRYINVALAIAVFVSLLLLNLEKTHAGLLAYFFIFERAIMSSLVLFVLLITAFLVYYPVPLKRNVIMYSIGYAAYFLVKTAAIFVGNLGYYWLRELSNIRLAASLACLVFWLITLNRDGETHMVVIGHAWNPADEERLFGQLKAINTSLLRIIQK